MCFTTALILCVQPIRISNKINNHYKPDENKRSFSSHVRTCPFFQIKILEKMAVNTHRISQ